MNRDEKFKYNFEKRGIIAHTRVFIHPTFKKLETNMQYRDECSQFSWYLQNPTLGPCHTTGSGSQPAAEIGRPAPPLTTQKGAAPLGSLAGRALGGSLASRHCPLVTLPFRGQSQPRKKEKRFYSTLSESQPASSIGGLRLECRGSWSSA